MNPTSRVANSSSSLNKLRALKYDERLENFMKNILLNNSYFPNLYLPFVQLLDENHLAHPFPGEFQCWLQMTPNALNTFYSDVFPHLT